MKQYEFWKMTDAAQQEWLGKDVGQEYPTIVVELDEASTRFFYNRRFAILRITQDEEFQVYLESVDDACLNMRWEVKNMQMPPQEARDNIHQWLKRSNYFLNLKGFENFCEIMFGKCKIDYS